VSLTTTGSRLGQRSLEPTNVDSEESGSRGDNIRSSTHNGRNDRLAFCSSSTAPTQLFPPLSTMAASNTLLPWDPNANGKAVAIQEPNSHQAEGSRWALILNVFLSPSRRHTLDRVYTAAGKVLNFLHFQICSSNARTWY
jgi:hypothetical protein